MLAERADDPALAARTVQQLQGELAGEEGSRLRMVMAALARPTRIVRGKEVRGAWPCSSATGCLPQTLLLTDDTVAAACGLTPLLQQSHLEGHEMQNTSPALDACVGARDAKHLTCPGCMCGGMRCKTPHLPWMHVGRGAD